MWVKLVSKPSFLLIKDTSSLTVVFQEFTVYTLFIYLFITKQQEPEIQLNLVTQLKWILTLV